jgi:hypothetical protein
MSGTNTTGGLSPAGTSASLQGSLDSNTIAQLVQQLLGASTGTSTTGGTGALPYTYQQPSVSNIVNPQNQYSTQAYATLLQQILAMMRSGGGASAGGTGTGTGTGNGTGTSGAGGGGSEAGGGGFGGGTSG